MATYYDGLNYIYKWFEDESCSASAQLTVLHLLHENNRHGNTGTVQISDRELGHRTSLSKQTITEAKRTLKNRGLIDFKTDRSKPRQPTTYTLTFFNELGQNVGQSVGQKVDQRVGQNAGQNALVSYTLTAGGREDKRRKNQDDAGARGGQGEVAAATGTPTQAKPLRSPYSEAEDVQELWEKTFGYALRGNRALELERLWSLDKERAKEGIERTKKRNEQLRRETRQGLADHFRYFNAVYDGLTPKTVKEDESPKVNRSLAEQLRYLEEISGER